MTFGNPPRASGPAATTPATPAVTPPAPTAIDAASGAATRTNQAISLAGLIGLRPKNRSYNSPNFVKNLQTSNFTQTAPSLIGGNR